ncbi:alpha-L-glutamate ligase-like protein [Leptospira ilyithenensis]|uniref:Alpha-L-glutamate ligase-like protein n=1 Tax=Leptospira ilyithenensis TaxID=2484901 RepID=A0A4R9LLA7_9LEPT|nr:alpha-L-glutamate ligase-like protein [Leptospira ilyithenensis]TGN06934.1 alpha-L-glutamate ligase-like protein [Leptospira ilyithenensis]
MISILRKFKEAGILGINRRIGEFILPLNPRANYPLVDDKWLTAELASKNGVFMPHHYSMIEEFGRVKDVPLILKDQSSFVVKPANGGMGNGILVIEKTIWNETGTPFYHKVGGKVLSYKDLLHHITGILSGLYSLDGNSDRAIFQEKLDAHPFFTDISYQGIPDIRVIVYRGYPVMAMVRLPTKESGGRANLHQGAIGVGVKIKEGEMTKIVHKDKIIFSHPDTGFHLEGKTIPHWEEILVLASSCFEISGLNYLGVDIVLDERRGPLLLEMNARPGLGIQIANQKGLLGALRWVDGMDVSPNSPQKRVETARQGI